MQPGWMRALVSVFLLSAVLAPVRAPASDNNEDPPYMIYIDPETGKYTTKDPQVRRPTDYDVQASSPPRTSGERQAVPAAPAAAGKIDRSGAFVAGALLVLTAGAAAWRFRRGRSGRMVGGR